MYPKFCFGGSIDYAIRGSDNGMTSMRLAITWTNEDLTSPT